MKKTISLLGICLLLLAGCSKDESNPKSVLNNNLKSAATDQWQTFMPQWTTQPPNPVGSVRYDNYNKMSFLSYCSSVNCGGSGAVVFTMTGGVKYRVSYSSLNSYCGGGVITTPAGTVQPGTSLEWTSGNCTFSGNGASSYGAAGYAEIVGLKFERLVEIPPIPNSIFATDTKSGTGQDGYSKNGGIPWHYGIPASESITRTVNGITYSGTIYLVSSTKGPVTIIDNQYVHIEQYSYTATYSGAIPRG